MPTLATQNISNSLNYHYNKILEYINKKFKRQRILADYVNIMHSSYILMIL